jgi:hypothetical protein
MTMRWKIGDAIPCSACGGRAVFTARRQAGAKGFFVCLECGERHYVLSELPKRGTLRAPTARRRITQA